MKTLIRTGCVLGTLLILACGGTSVQKAPEPPRITSFEASARTIGAGESVTLTFTADNAHEVVLTDDAGNQIELTGTASQGEATITLTRSTFFVLNAAGQGGRDAAFLEVSVGEDLRDVFLIAVPPVVDPGQRVQLLWGARHARSGSLRSSDGTDIPLDVTQNTGIVEVAPERTDTFTLSASGADGSQTHAATARVEVRPTLVSFTASPSAARAGETMTFSWTTRGATEIVLSEATFGELTRLQMPQSAASQIDQGTYTFTLPETLPTGAPVTEGRPLRFTLTVATEVPAVTITRSLDSYVGDGPKILEFDAPVAVTEGRPLTFSWRTFNATRLQLLADGAVIYEPLPGQTDVVESGSFTIPGPTQSTLFVLRAFGHLGGEASEVREVQIVRAPVIDSFTMPAQVASPDSPATATWSTRHATLVVLRVDQGPALYRTKNLVDVASGSTSVYVGSRATFTLEAFNAAGDSVSARATVDVATPGTIIASPAPSLGARR